MFSICKVVIVKIQKQIFNSEIFDFVNLQNQIYQTAILIFVFLAEKYSVILG